MGAKEISEKGYVLVIDDDPLLLKTLKKALEKAGYFVDTAKDGYEGIKKAKTGFFHLILCDIRMPGLDGIMTIQHIQEFQRRAGTGKSGFIVISAYGSDEIHKRAFQLGVTDFLSKPFDLSKFLEAMESHIRPLVKQTPTEEVARLNHKLEQLLSAVHPDESKNKKHKKK